MDKPDFPFLYKKIKLKWRSDMISPISKQWEPIIVYSGDLNNEHLNNGLLLVWYSDVRYSNGSLVFRPPFEYWSGIQVVYQIPDKIYSGIGMAFK